MTRMLLLALLTIGQPIPVLANDAKTSDEQEATPPLVGQLMTLAEQGNAEARYHLGMFYNNGVGVPRSPSQALSYFRQSAQGGDPLGKYKLGCYLVGQFGDIDGLTLDTRQGMALKEEAARAGYALAQYDVAGFYFKQNNAEQALAWLQRAAGQGYRPALFAIALLYSEEDLPVYDPVKAHQYFLLLPDSAGGERLEARRKNIEKALSDAQKAQARKQAAAMEFASTVLTQQAQAGQDRAKKLVSAELD